MPRSPAAVSRPLSQEERTAFGDLFRQQSDRLWNADTDIDWTQPAVIPAEKREAWLRLMSVYHGLETMGLDTIQVMMSKATHKLRDPNLSLYLAAQYQDEARHVSAIDRYLTTVDGHGHMSRAERLLVDRFGTLAAWGFYRVENWLASTLFSANFAALFLQRCLEIPDIDPLAKSIFRLIRRDEVRHVNFLHTILPRLMERLSPLGRLYVWQSQILLVGAVSVGMRRIRDDAGALGIDIEDFKETLLGNLEAQFRDAGSDRFLQASAYRRVINALV